MLIPRAAMPNQKLDAAFVSPGRRRLDAVAFREGILTIWQTTGRIARPNLPNARTTDLHAVPCVSSAAVTARRPTVDEPLEDFTEGLARVPTVQLKKALVGVYQVRANRHPICTYPLSVVSTDPNHSSQHLGCLCTALGLAITLHYHGTVMAPAWSSARYRTKQGHRTKSAWG